MRALIREAKRESEPREVYNAPFNLRNDMRTLKKTKVGYLKTLSSVILTERVGCICAKMARLFIEHCTTLSFVGVLIPCPAKDIGFTLDRMRKCWSDLAGPYITFPCVDDASKCVLIIDRLRLRLVRSIQLSLIPGTIPVYPIFVQLFSRVPTKGHTVFQLCENTRVWTEIRTETNNLENVIIKMEKETDESGVNEPEKIYSLIIDENAHAWMLYGLCLRIVKYVSNKTLKFIIKNMPKPSNPGFRVMQNIGKIIELFSNSAWDMHTAIKNSFTKTETEGSSLYEALEAFLLQRSGVGIRIPGKRSGVGKLISYKHKGSRLCVTRSAIDIILDFCERDKMEEEYHILVDIIAKSLKKCNNNSADSIPLLGEYTCYEKETGTNDIEPPAYYWYQFCFSEKNDMKSEIRLKLIRSITIYSKGFPPTNYSRYMTSTQCKAQHLRDYYASFWENMKTTHPCYTEMHFCPGRSVEMIKAVSDFLRMAEFVSAVKSNTIDSIPDVSGECNVDPFLLTPAGSNYANLPAVGITTKEKRTKQCSPTKDELEKEIIRFEDFFAVFSPPKKENNDITNIPDWVLQEAHVQHPLVFYDAIKDWVNTDPPERNYAPDMLLFVDNKGDSERNVKKRTLIYNGHLNNNNNNNRKKIHKNNISKNFQVKASSLIY